MRGLVAGAAARGLEFDLVGAIRNGGKIVGLTFDNASSARHIALDDLLQTALATVIAFLLRDIDLIHGHSRVVLNVDRFAIVGVGAEVHRVGRSRPSGK